ncbi:hypothetical protein A2368_02855 [Candidatus Collierbacteria bacterium RIFOXYB1_FULL_49_13]|uniref:Uncharacterized protein n=1 Tax=Candidatus Collierbacteria bacterium RIFOXYB1_FULL_49_13 TaxID=1817728 RepID=A0A1F5FF17_9BACT|nr:MAG: hypothetical protein A2368_02855 [Candidatus Collierbacteria bacterium RIFOXYB1_FULL_49_13]
MTASIWMIDEIGNMKKHIHEEAMGVDVPPGQVLSYKDTLYHTRHRGPNVTDVTFPGTAKLTHSGNVGTYHIEIIAQDNKVTLAEVLAEAQKLEEIAGTIFLKPHRLGFILPDGITSAWKRLAYLVRWVVKGSV